ncbi:MAG: efflux RND transporter periplasmic adaptor subunit [Thalassolituus sp.]
MQSLLRLSSVNMVVLRAALGVAISVAISVAIGLALGISFDATARENGELSAEASDLESTVQHTIPVQAVTISQQPVYESRTFSGTTRAVNRAVMRSQISGRVDYLPIKLGQAVKKGQLLAELYNPEAAPAARSARVRWQQLQDQQGQQQRDFERISALYEQGQASRQDFEQARTALNSANDAALGAESEYQRASGLDQERQIRAPFQGVITSISTDVGEVVSPGQALLQVADPSAVELEVVVSSAIATSVKPGHTVTVRLPVQSGVQRNVQTNVQTNVSTNAPINRTSLNSAHITARVTEVSPFRDRTALPSVVLEFDSKVVTSGTAVSAQFKMPVGQAFVVPSNALVRQGMRVIVYRLMASNTVEPVAVTLGAVQTEGIQISGELDDGDRIIVTGSQRLFHGASVQVMP